MLERRRPAREAAMLRTLDERSWRWIAGPFRALGFSFAVRSMDADAGQYLAAVLAPLAGDGPTSHVYSIVDHGGRRALRYVVYLDGRFLTRAPHPAAAVSYVLWHLNRSVVRESSQYLVIHAAAAAFGGQALLLPAASEAGKTTLVAGLVQRGLGYLTDEAVGIDPVSGLAHPYPKSLSVDPGSWDVLATLKPRLEEGMASFASTQWHVDPRSIRPDSVSGPCPVGLVISPRYRLGGDTRLLAITRAQGAALLFENSFNFRLHGATGLDAVARAIRDADCYQLEIGSLEAACDAVMGLAARRAPAADVHRVG